MRKQSEVALAYQTEVAILEQQRTENSETLREIDTMRTQWRVPGGSLLALGVAGLIGGITAVATGAPPLWTVTLFAITGGLLLAGSTQGAHIADYIADLASSSGRVQLHEREVTP